MNLLHSFDVRSVKRDCSLQSRLFLLSYTDNTTECDLRRMINKWRLYGVLKCFYMSHLIQQYKRLSAQRVRKVLIAGVLLSEFFTSLQGYIPFIQTMNILCLLFTVSLSIVLKGAVDAVLWAEYFVFAWLVSFSSSKRPMITRDDIICAQMRSVIGCVWSRTSASQKTTFSPTVLWFCPTLSISLSLVI